MFRQPNHARILITLLLTIFLLVGCGRDGGNQENKPQQAKNSPTVMISTETEQKTIPTPNDAAKTTGNPGDKPVSSPAQPGNNQTVGASVSPAAESKAIGIKALSKDMVFFAANIEIKTGDSVFAVTRHAAAQAKIELDTQGFGPTAYIAGIGGLREFDQGPLSGWLYQVNGQIPNLGCGMYKLKPGDQVVWIYTTDGRKQ